MLLCGPGAEEPLRSLHVREHERHRAVQMVGACSRVTEKYLGSAGALPYRLCIRPNTL
jgi:hypothetical protein